MLDHQKAATIESNRIKLRPIVKSILFCAENNLALRGHREESLQCSKNVELKDWISGHQGVFRAVLAMRIDAGDMGLKHHLNESQRNSNLVSGQIQNEIIESIGRIIQQDIIARVIKSEYFSILCDETTDISTQEQIVFCLRYVDVDSDKIREDFLGFEKVNATTRAMLKATILQFLKNLGVSISKCRGQGYDGGANMSGKLKGVQALISNDNPLAFYTHCFSHTLNLVISASCEIRAIRNMLGIVGQVSNFFTGSAKRQHYLSAVIAKSSVIPETRKSKLKSYNPTRWVERHDSLITFRELFPYILLALEEIQEIEVGDVSSKAMTLESAMGRSEFVIALQIGCSCLEYTMILSKRLQEKSIDLSKAVAHVKTVATTLKEMLQQSQISFKTIYERAEELAAFAGTSISTPRRAPRQTHRDNFPATTAEDYYRNSVYKPFLSHIISELNERFSDRLARVFPLEGLIPSKLCCYTDEQILESAWIYEQDLSCISKTVLNTEIAIWRNKWNDLQDLPCDSLDALAQCDEFSPNIRILLRLFATLPVTTASPERCFSVLRLLKTYLRSTMKESRLNGLALAYIYKCGGSMIEHIMEDFARSKPRRMKLTDWSKD